MIHRLVLAVVLLALPWAAAGQVATVAPEERGDEAVVDADDVLGRARDAQRRFERIRLRNLPQRLGGSRGPCDEYVGRFCTTYDEGEWVPEEEDEETSEARRELLVELDSLQSLVPDEGWILGQRVWYRAEAGDWQGALVTARRCEVDERWWCAALRGLALHGLGRYRAAVETFEGALDDMTPEDARAWRVPERAVDGDAWDVLRDAEAAGPETLEQVLGTLWTLADPLYLADGNDRLSAHYARWTVSEIKRDARNPYGISWADDLEELTVRHGWELGWERVRSSPLASNEVAVGHKHPEGGDFLPRGRALRAPAGADAEDFATDPREPRSLYAPAYAPVLLPMEGQLAVFPRGDRMAVVATAFLPEDTTYHAGHDHGRFWMEPGEQAGMPDRIGLFALGLGSDVAVQERREGSAEGVLLVEVPVGPYVVSAESWSPERRRAGRLRLGVDRERAPEDVPTLSDLLLLAPAPATPASLADALPLALLRPRIGPDEGLAIAWELSGLGFREETLEYSVSVERTDRGVLRRLGDFLGLTERPRPLALAWQEPAPDVPGHRFRHLDLELPPLAPGAYEITLTLRSPGRSDVVVTRAFEVVEGD